MSESHKIKYELISYPVQGKTYNLFADSVSTEGYFELVSRTIDSMILEFGNNEILLKKLSLSHKNQSDIKINNYLNDFKKYTIAAEEHLKNISLYTKLFERRLSTNERLHHLYMLETALMNRMNKEIFLKCEYKLALLPHCLHDLSRTCKSVSYGFEYTCAHCSKRCYISAVSDILEEHGIHPYIRRNIPLKKQLKILNKKYKSIGVLGIACIPELAAGMWSCMKFGVPVVGIPLNANRCIRWMGEFKENSVNLNVLRELVT